MTWYKTGTVQVTLNSNAVVGTGTAFIANARVGDAFSGPDGNWYEVINVVSNTSLGIYPNYRGASVASGGVYVIAPMEGYVKDSADALRAATQAFGLVADDINNKASKGANSDITSLSGLTTPLSIIQGGTGGNTAASSRTGLGLGSAAVENIVPLTKGGTGGTSAESARVGLNAASLGANSDITSLTGLTTPLSVTQGGTGGNSQATAQTALGLVKVTSNTDSTIGRLVTPGWMGLGGPVVPVNSGNFNTFGNASIFIISNSSSNGPTGGTGSFYVIHMVATPDQYIYQRATDITTGRTWERQMKAGLWAASWTAVNSWGAITGTLSVQTDLQTALDAKLSLSDDKRVPKAWVRFNSSGGVIDNFNTPTVTRNSAGDFSLNHTIALPSATRLVLVTGSITGGAITLSDGCYGTYWGSTGSTASLTRVRFLNYSASAFIDPSVGFVIVY